MGGGRLYLALTLIFTVILFLAVVLPYMMAYPGYLQGLKSFSPGAVITYRGHLNYPYFIVSENRVMRGVYDYELKLNYTDSGINALLTMRAWNGSVVFNASKNISRDSALLEFLLPSSNSMSLDKLNARISICEKTGSISTTPGFQPSIIGVPPRHPAILLVNNTIIVSDEWNRAGCEKVNGKMEYYDYFKLENRYMLEMFTSTWPGDVELIRNGGGLVLRLLAEEFGEGVQEIIIPSDVLEAAALNSSNVIIRYFDESAVLDYSNVYPEEQKWLEAMFSTYVALMPISLVLTVLAVLSYALYRRRR